MCHRYIIRGMSTESLLSRDDNFEEYDVAEFGKDCPGYIYNPTVLSKRDRIIVIGDLHGDYNLMINSLKLSKVIDDNLDWIGKDTIVVQVGDQIDRCRPFNRICSDPSATINDEASDITILKFLTNLHKKALEHGGAVISLLGNHELMNVMGNLNYVSYLGLKEFEDYKDPKNPSLKFNSGVQARAHAFRPGNEFSRLLACSRLSTVIIGNFIFVHAGIIPEFVNKVKIEKPNDLYRLNYLIRKWLLGLINKDYVADIIDSFKYSMFWNRILGNIPPNISNYDPICIEYLEPVLKMFKVGHMVIGHTPQFFTNKSGINKTCGDSLWRVDTGSSNAFLQFDSNYIEDGSILELRNVQVLEILDDHKISILKMQTG